MKIRSFQNYKKLYRTLHPKLYESIAVIKRKGKAVDCITLYRDTMEEETDCMSPNLMDMFFHAYNNNPINVVLVEGSPGIGKTTLCNEIAFRLAKGELLTSSKLLFFLFLQDPDVQKISTIQKFAEYFTQSTNETRFLRDYLENKGDVTIILDGYNELSSELRNSSFFTELIQGHLLPNARIVVTSRPTASDCLHSTVDQVVEILGFNKTSRDQYIAESLKDCPSTIVKLHKHLQQYPNIDALCYLPSVALIVTSLCLYQPDNLPSTASKLYEKFIVMTLCKSKKLTLEEKVINNMEEFPQPVFKVLQKLAEVAFTNILADKSLLTAGELPDMCKDDPTCYGLLESYNSKSFSFLHFVLQEYLAAYHITTLDSKAVNQLLKDLFFSGRFKSCSDNSIRLCNVWVLYFGITGRKNPSASDQLKMIHGYPNPVIFLNPELFSVLQSSNFATEDSPACTIPHDASMQLETVQSLMLNKNTLIANMQLKPVLQESFSSNRFLQQEIDDLRKVFYLFRCFQEAEDDIHCEALFKSFDDGIIRLKDYSPLIPYQVESLGLFLAHRKWATLVLSNCQFGDRDMILLHRYLCSDIKEEQEIAAIDLMDNNLTALSLPFISDIIMNCRTRAVKLGCNNLNNLKDITSAVVTYKLKVLNLWGCGLTAREASALSDMMISLKQLIVSNNNLSDDGAKLLSDGLAKTNTLQELYINDNNISQQGIVAIAHALMENTSLEILNMTNNSIGLEGAIAISEALIKNRTLTELSLYGENTLKEEAAKLLLEKLCSDKSTIDLLGFPKRLASDNCIMSCIENVNEVRKRYNVQDLKFKFH